MKTQRMITGGILLVGLISLNFTSPEKLVTDESVKLMDAEMQFLVKVDVKSKGHYSGDCMNLTLTNLKQKATKILVPAGTVFIADDASEQNILVTHDIICLLKPGENKVFDMTGFCCEMHDSAPNEGSGFKTSMHKDEKVLKLVEFLKTKDYDEGAVQEAVWAVANDGDPSNINMDDEVKGKELRKFVCDLTGKPETWYTTVQNRQLDEERRISNEPTEIKGMLSCTIDKPIHVSNYIYNSENELIYTMGEPMLFPRKGHYEYEFKLTVEGWEKGTYYVLVKGDDKELLKQEFKI